MITLSVIAPFYEENSIDLLIKNWLNYLESFTQIANFEILLFNDGSSAEFNSKMVNKLNKFDPRVIIINSYINTYYYY
jgi:glycosyltransferase involved in cell wall biosynthesis